MRKDEHTDAVPPPAQFEQEWRERFGEFATMRDDDAGIAGWSASGLAARIRFFRRHWRVPASVDPLFLDLGCGAGTYSRLLAEQGLRVVGVDYSLPTLTRARDRISGAISLCAADAMRLPFANAMFDGALCLGVLQAVRDSMPVVRELARVLRPGSSIWIDALNRGAAAAWAERARLRLQGKSMHLRYESPWNLERALRQCGFVDLQRHWLPILPARFQRAQPLVETGAFRTVLRSIYPLGSVMSHSFVFTARRNDA